MLVSLPMMWGIEKSSMSVIVAIDSSGSMLKTDSQNMRKNATALFLEMLKTGDQVAVLEFADSLNVLVSPQVIQNPAHKETLISKLQNITTGGNTRMDIALEEAIKLFEDSDYDNKAIILLSDGALDVDGSPFSEKSKKALQNMMQNTLPKLKKNNIKVYSISLTNETADQNSQELQQKTMQTLAQETGGSYEVAPSSIYLHKNFLDVLQTLTDPPRLPYKLIDDHLVFQIDETIKNAHIMINKEKSTGSQITLKYNDQSYTGSVEDIIQWNKSPEMDLITLLEKPENGFWKVFSTGPIEALKLNILADTVYKLSPPAIEGKYQASELLTITTEMLKKESESGPSQKVSLEDSRVFLDIAPPTGQNILLPMKKTKEQIYKTLYTPSLEGNYKFKTFSKGQIERESELESITMAPEPLDVPKVFLDQSVYALGETLKLTVQVKDDRTAFPQDFISVNTPDGGLQKLAVKNKARSFYATFKTTEKNIPGNYEFNISYYNLNGELKEKKMVATVIGAITIATEKLNFSKLNNAYEGEASIELHSDLELTSYPVKLEVHQVILTSKQVKPGEIRFTYPSEFFIKDASLKQNIIIKLEASAYHKMQKLLTSHSLKGIITFKLYSRQNELLSTKDIAFTLAVPSKLESNKYILLALLLLALLIIGGITWWSIAIRPYKDNLKGSLLCLKVPAGQEKLLNSVWPLKYYQKVFIGSSSLNEIQCPGLAPEHIEIYIDRTEDQKQTRIKPATPGVLFSLNEKPVTEAVNISPDDRISLNGFEFTWKI
jgi:hypothetical protein